MFSVGQQVTEEGGRGRCRLGRRLGHVQRAGLAAAGERGGDYGRAEKKREGGLHD
jgi:hypothetical protein